LAEKSIYTADLTLIATRFSQALLQEIFMSKWWLPSKINLVNSLNTNFQTCQFNENRLFISG